MDIKRRNIQYTNTCPVYFLAAFGCASTFLSELALYPLEYVKTRLQMNGTQGCSKFKNSRQIIIQVNQKTLLYRGLNAHMLKTIPFSTTKVFAYEFIKSAFTGNIIETSYLRKLSTSSSAYGMALLIGNMGDILRIRMINSNDGISLIKAIQQSYQKTGFIGFFRGYWLNLTNIVVLQSLEIAIFEKLKKFFSQNFALKQNSLPNEVVASLVTGISGGLITAPFDGFKTRYMNHFDIKYWNALIAVIKDEGLFALYKGTVPYCIKISFGSMLTLVLYEQFKKQVV